MRNFSELLSNDKDVKQYNKIDGLLLLFGILLILNFCFSISALGDAGGYFTNDLKRILIRTYPTLYPLEVFQLISQVLFVLMYIFLIALFYKRTCYFPKLIIMFKTITIVYVLFSYLLTINVHNLPNINGSENLTKLFLQIIISLVWIVYFALSKRVKGTFTN